MSTPEPGKTASFNVVNAFKAVSNVINNHPHVWDTTRARVEQEIEELGYRPNLTARSLRSGHTGAITLAHPQLSLP
ncbi:LacI family DNA-binding transcriptional regulator [Pseudarthrobacter sp. DSP2-3-2b1]|uniref:LacI family DNA-binding transcriptional regulator n=1 Tax=Pseudarthrobacter sp. DSP2-3-2b1 TaxID=2804661 RepID=UPI003CEAC12E